MNVKKNLELKSKIIPPGLVLIEPCVFSDSRGFFSEIYNRRTFEAIGITTVFVQDNHSGSRRGVVRGLHYQLLHPQAKLIYVVSGEIFDAAVDIRLGSPTFGQWAGVNLSAGDRRLVFVPEGFAHGFRVLSDTAGVMYKCSGFYQPGDEYGIFWNDPAIGIGWPGTGEIHLSRKDGLNPLLNDVPRNLLPKYKG